MAAEKNGVCGAGDHVIYDHARALTDFSEILTSQAEQTVGSWFTAWHVHVIESWNQHCISISANRIRRNHSCTRATHRLVKCTTEFIFFTHVVARICCFFGVFICSSLAKGKEQVWFFWESEFLLRLKGELDTVGAFKIWREEIRGPMFWMFFPWNGLKNFIQLLCDVGFTTRLWSKIENISKVKGNPSFCFVITMCDWNEYCFFRF